MGPRPKARKNVFIEDLDLGASDASMGPRPKARKNDSREAQQDLGAVASMGPRPKARKNWPDKTARSCPRVRRFNGAAPEGAEEHCHQAIYRRVWIASMGPRPKARKNTHFSLPR